MRTLTVIQTLPALEGGGVERGTLEVAAELVRRGHRSVVVSAGGSLAGELIESGSEHYVVPVGRKSPLVLQYIPRLRKIMRDTQATIVHARSRLPAWICHLALKGMSPAGRPRFVTSVHGAYRVNRYSRIMTSGERVIAISEFIRDYITGNYPGVPVDRIILIPRGISRERYPHGYRPAGRWLEEWYREYPRLRGKVLLTLPGRITRRKGHEDFLRILADLGTGSPGLHGLVAGGAQPGHISYYNELTSLAETLGLRDRVTFTGHRQDLREIMSISHIVMSLSNEPEAFGRTTLEALSLGVPVIAYNHGGASEIMRAIFPSGMVPRNDTAAAAALAARFLHERPDIPDVHPYSLQRMLDRTIEIYESLAS
jgi:glycosyltransferase involved in cell wall biosynthesis